MRGSSLQRSFTTDDAGTTAIIFAISLTAIIGMVGAAVDGARWLSARQQHAVAIDAALLAGARSMQVVPDDDAAAETAAAKVYQNDLPKGVKIVDNSIRFAKAEDDATFSFTGSAHIQTTFLNVVGITKLPIHTPAKAQFKQSGLNKGSNLEIALMLDVTGSMCDDGTGPCTSGTKMTGLKAAATDLATIVLGGSSNSYTSRIALVPFSSAIRLDADGTSNPLMKQLTNMPATWSGWVPTYTNCTGGNYYIGEIYVNPTCTTVPQYVTNWKLMPCVTERTFDAGAGFDAGDSAPGKSNWLLGQGGNRDPLAWDSSDTPQTTNMGSSATDLSGTWNYSFDGSGCMSQPGNEVLPLTSNKAAVTDRIGTLQAYGPTAGALATVWTQYMLSPNWSGIWNGSQRPGAYSDTTTLQSNGAPLLRKVAVLMTDGGFNTSRQNAVDTTAQMQTVSDQAIAVCTKMKNNGIEVYTVGFNLDGLASSERAIATTTLKACGTDLSHFYSSLTANDLQTAFRDIALKISPVRLTQ